MADPKHTPAPLTWRESDGYLHVESSIGTIAIVFSESRTPNGGRTGVVGDEGEWNARLFAAAPDLLTELQAALPFLDCDHASNESECPACERVKRVKAVIEKAVGRG